MMSVLTDLPHGWEWKRLSEFSEIIMGQSPSSSSYNEDSEGLPFFQGKAEFGAIYPKVRKWCTEPTKIAEKGDILLSVRAPVGPTNICPEKACIGRGLAAIRGRNGISSLFLLYLLRAFQPDLVKEATGTTFEAVTGDKVRNLLLPLPPLDEQQRIVARIEELFTQLNAGVAALEAVRAQVKRYRQAVLQAAVRGRLTRDWRRKKFGEDENWHWEEAQYLCEFITKGTTPSREKLFENHGEVPFIKVYNLTFDGSLDFSVSPTYVTRKTHEFELARSKVVPGDILMNIVGPPLGKVSIVPPTFEEWNINQAIARFRPLSCVNNRFLSICLQSNLILEWARKRAKTTAGQTNLTLEICRNLPLPLPSLEEQEEIVLQVDDRLSVANHMELSINQSLQQAARLRQSILQRAFTGKL